MMDKQADLITVVVPVYNTEQYLPRCMNSLLGQTYSNLEIILVDDGSKQVAAEMCDQWQQKDRRVRTLHTANAGAGAAKNRGIEIAKGRYITFVDSDDYVHPQFIEILYRNLIQNDADISLCKFISSKSSEDDAFQTVSLDTSTQMYTSRQMLEKCCALHKVAEVAVWCKLYKIELWKNVKYREGHTYEDLATSHLLYAQAKKVVCCSAQLYVYYQCPTSLMNSKYSLERFDAENSAQDLRLAFYRGLNDSELYQKLLRSVLRNRIANYCKCMRELQGCEAQAKQLYCQFYEEYGTLKLKLKPSTFVDKALFLAFRISPDFCKTVLWPIYMKTNRMK